MNHSQINIRYAKALFDLALDRKVLEQVKDDMFMIDQTCHENRELRGMLHNPVINVAKKQKVMRLLFGKQINELTLAFIDILARKRRESYIDGIAAAFVNLYNEFKGIKKAYVTSAVSLSPEEKLKMVSILGNLTDMKIELEEKQNENLIGGFILQMDNYQVDQSLTSKIKDLKKDFDKNLYVKGF